jgi:flagellar assembly protein FliH
MIIKKKNQKRKQDEYKQELQNQGSSVSDNQENENAVIEKKITEPEPEIDLFDVENIDFTQRQERRRGSRRRGYRRIDDRNLVSRAQEESENIKKSAFEEGYRMGLEKSEADMAQFREEFVKFMSARKEVFEYIAPDIMEISVDIAKKIIKKELESDPQFIINTIVDVLKTVSKNEPKVTLRVKPQMVQFIKDTLPTVTYQYGIESKINIIADPAIEDGGCVFQTGNGIVDASIDTQLEIIKKALVGG